MSVVTIGIRPETLGCGHDRYESDVSRKRRPIGGRVKARLFREATEILSPFTIDWSQYEAPVIHGFNDCPHMMGWKISIHWRKKDDPALEVILSEVWWDRKTGAILQAGSNCGSLIF